MDASPQQDHSQQGALAEPAPRVRCRPAKAADVDAIVALLARGFPDRSQAYWTQALARLAAHATPRDYPKYGYVLEVADRLIGVVLLIFSQLNGGDTAKIHCNVSSWYVEEAYRGFAPLLIATAIREKSVTYINVSPAPHTHQIVETQGFIRYAQGQYYCLPFFAAPAPGIHIRTIEPGLASADPTIELLSAHADYGCLSVMCEWNGETFPFIFLPRPFARNLLQGAQLVYCREPADFARFAGPLGRFLLKRGLHCVIMDANGPISGLIGRYYPGKAPKYYRGPEPPGLSDIAFTETVLFGF